MTFLILRDWRSAICPVLLSAAAAGAGLLLCSVIFGNVFIENLLTLRDYRLSNLLGQIGHLQWVALALLIWGIWAVNDRSKAARFTALLVGWGLFSCLLQWFGMVFSVTPSSTSSWQPASASASCSPGRKAGFSEMS